MAEITYTTEEAFFDTEFISTKIGLVRICQFVCFFLFIFALNFLIILLSFWNIIQVISLLSLIVIEIPRCKFLRSVNFYVFIASYCLIFSILVIIIFITRFYRQLEQYINLPLTVNFYSFFSIIILNLIITFFSVDGQ